MKTRKCKLCSKDKPEFEFKEIRQRNVTKNDYEEYFTFSTKCHDCDKSIRRFEGNSTYQNNQKAIKMLKEVKENKDPDMNKDRELELLKELETVKEYNEELMRQMQIILPMVHKDARKMYYEMHPHMDRFRDPNAGRKFYVVNLGTEENLGLFHNVGMVSEELGIASAKIEAVLKGRFNQTAGFTFYYENEEV